MGRNRTHHRRLPQLNVAGAGTKKGPELGAEREPRYLPQKKSITSLVSQILLIQTGAAEGNLMQHAILFQQSKGGDPMSHGSVKGSGISVRGIGC